MLRRSVLVLVVAACTATEAQVANDTVADEIATLNWQFEPQAYEVGSINAVYTLRSNEALLLGADASRFMTLTQGTTWADVLLVAYQVKGSQTASFISVQHFAVGYLNDDDWVEVDFDAVMRGVKASTKEANTERLANGFPALHVVGWLKRPHYDRAQDTVYWAMEAVDDEGFKSVNAVALKLSRDGFSRITWVGSPEQFSGSDETLLAAGDAYDFKDGSQYADFSAGDQVAAVGLGAIAANMMRGKSIGKTGAAVGAGLLAVVAAFAKKL